MSTARTRAHRSGTTYAHVGAHTPRLPRRVDPRLTHRIMGVRVSPHEYNVVTTIMGATVLIAGLFADAAHKIVWGWAWIVVNAPIPF